MTTLLAVQGLSVEIRVQDNVLRPVRGVDLTVNEGETVAVVGESGCGKSLTALAIMALVPRGATVVADKIDLGGISLNATSPAAMRRIRGSQVAMIFQDPMTALDSCYRVGDQIIEIMKQHRRITRAEARDEAYRLLERVGIPAPRERFYQYPHQLSGGLRQRVMIAMALSCDPALLIADEPTTALDVTVQAQILGLLADIQRERGMGLLLITHDLGVVSGLADRVAVMYGGEIVESGPAAAVVQQPLHPYTEGLLKSLPIPGRTRRGQPLETIPGVVPLQVGVMRRCGFANRCQYARAECVKGPISLRSYGKNRQYRCVLTRDSIVAKNAN